MGKIAVGVDLGATNVRVALGGDDGTIFSRLKESTIKDQGAQGQDAACEGCRQQPYL